MPGRREVARRVDPLGRRVGDPALGLGRDPLLVPAELGADRLGDRRDRLGAAQLRRGEHAEPGAAQQHVGDRARLLEPGRDRRLGEQVGLSGDDRRRQLGALAGEPQHVAGRVAVAEGELLAIARRQVGLGEPLGRVEVVLRRRHPERDVGGAAGGLAALALDHPVDDLLRHPPPGRQLAAGDRQHPRRGLVQLRLARDVDRLARVAGRDQRPHPGVGAGQVAAPELECRRRRWPPRAGSRCRHRRAGRGRCRRRSRCRSSRSAPARTRAGRRSSAPRRRGRCRPRADRQLLQRHGDVGAAAGSDPRHLGLVVDLVGPDPVGPDAGRVDRRCRPRSRTARPTRPSTQATPVADPSPVEQPGDLGPVEADRAEALGLAEDRQHEADVVGLAVVEQVGLARVAIGERRDQLGDLLAGDRAVAVGRPVVVARRSAGRARGATSRPGSSPSRRTC